RRDHAVRNPFSKALCLISVAGIVNATVRAEDVSLPKEPVPALPASSDDASASHTPLQAPSPAVKNAPASAAPLAPGEARTPAPLSPPPTPTGNPALPPPNPPGPLRCPAASSDVLLEPAPERGTCVDEPVGMWLDADYLLWWTKGDRVPPLVSRAVPAGS